MRQSNIIEQGVTLYRYNHITPDQFIEQAAKFDVTVRWVEVTRPYLHTPGGNWSVQYVGTQENLQSMYADFENFPSEADNRPAMEAFVARHMAAVGYTEVK